MKGKIFIVNKFYSDIVKGTEGVCVKYWVAKNGEWVKLNFGKNLSGQKLEKGFPIDMVCLKENLNKEMKESDKFCEIHDKIKFLIDGNDFVSVNNLMSIYINDKKSSVGSLKSILVITKSFKDNDIIRESRKEIVSLLEKKLGKKLA